MGKKEEIDTLNINKDFKRAYYQGKYKAHPLLVTYAIKNKSKKIRYGITTSKKIGNAVQRNRARRIIKQAFYDLLKSDEIPLNYCDYVFVARSETPISSSNIMKKIMKKQINDLLVK